MRELFRVMSVALILGFAGGLGCVKPPAGYPGANQSTTPLAQNTAEPTLPAAGLPETAVNSEAAEPQSLPAERIETVAKGGKLPVEGANVAEPESAPQPAATGAPAPAGPAAVPPASAPSASARAREAPAPRAEPRPRRPAIRLAQREPAAKAAGSEERPTTKTRKQPEKRPTKPRPPRDDPAWQEIVGVDWGQDGKYPWASDVKLSERVLSRYDEEELTRMGLEIYARRGKRFDDPVWQKRFDAESWYYGDHRYTDKRLSPTERRNIELIRQHQRKRFGRTSVPAPTKSEEAQSNLSGVEGEAEQSAADIPLMNE